MERLTYYSMKGSENDGWYLKPGVTRENANEKLADYEDAEEQGLLLKLPCHVGDTVYEITDQLDVMTNQMSKTIAKRTVIGIKGNKLNPLILICESALFEEYHYTPSAFGLRVFLTEKEAEAALAEKGGAE